MPSDLERIAQGLIDYLDQNPRMSADLRNAGGQCMELASLVGELAVLLPGAAAAAEHLAAAAHACDEAATLSANATTLGRTWAISAVGGAAGPSPAGTANRNPATTLNREDRADRADEDRDRSDAAEREEQPESEDQADRPAQRDATPTPLDLPLPEPTPPPVVTGDPNASENLDDGPEPSEDKQPEPEERKPFNLDLKFGEGDDEITARDILKRYDPAKANLPEMTLAEAVDYITANKEARPWLAPAADCEPEVQRVYATLDNGLGHAHHRHDGLGEDTLYERRVAYLEDPAQTNPTKRAKSEDAFNPGNLHYCAQEATRISDPRAFATALARIIEHPDVQAALSMEWDPVGRPDALRIPIAEILGPDGHEHCVGYRLNGPWPASKRARETWARARAEDRDTSNLPEPSGKRIATFEDGMMAINFQKDRDAERYEIGTVYANPKTSDES